MRKFFTLTVTCALLALPSLAQEQKDDSPRPPLPNRGGCIAIPDDTYDGTQASMTCMAMPGTAGLVQDVEVAMGLDHTWVGDLTVKLYSPMGTELTLQSRAGFAETADDGTGCCGDSSDMVATSPVTYTDTSANSAEDMGSTILGGEFVCQDDGVCDYFPFPDQGPGTNLDDFDGEEGAGDWMLCVGDAAGGDTGQFCSADLTLTTLQVPVTEVPTASTWGLLALLVGLGGVGVLFLRRA